MHAANAPGSLRAPTPTPAHASGQAKPPGPVFLNTIEAGTFLRLSPRTLEKQRVLGGGPRFRKFGARVVYAMDDLRAWADSRAYGMTSDPGYAQRPSAR